MTTIKYKSDSYQTAVSHAKSTLGGIEKAGTVKITLKNTNLSPFSQIEDILTAINNLTKRYVSAAETNYSKMSEVGKKIEEEDKGLAKNIRDSVRFP